MGLVVGYEWGAKKATRKEQHDAPVPDYDVNNPINARGHRGEVVEICGVPMTRMN